MSSSHLSQLENAVGRLLQRNTQLQETCDHLLAEQETWRSQQLELLSEVDDLLSRLETLQEQQK